jgi:hypothetical protein
MTVVCTPSWKQQVLQLIDHAVLSVQHPRAIFWRIFFSVLIFGEVFLPR